MDYTVASVIRIARNREHLCKQRESIDWNAWDKGCKTGYLRAMKEVLTLLEKIKEESAPEEQEKEKPMKMSGWKPTKGDEYYFLMALSKNRNVETATPMATVWQDSKADYMRYAQGNCYPTQREAVKHGSSFLLVRSRKNEKYKKVYDLGMYGSCSPDISAV